MTPSKIEEMYFTFNMYVSQLIIGSNTIEDLLVDPKGLIRELGTFMSDNFATMALVECISYYQRRKIENALLKDNSSLLIVRISKYYSRLKLALMEGNYDQISSIINNRPQEG